MKDFRLDVLKEKNLEIVMNLIREKGKYKILSEYTSFFDMRSYFKVDENGNIFKKSYNPIALIFAFCDDEKKLAEYLFKYSYPQEKQNIKKIDRATNLDIETLKKNLMKTLVGANLDFSKVFAKELFLRDKKSFYEVLYNFSLMGNPNDLKLFFTFALEKIFNEIDYDENIFYIFIAYLTKFRDDFDIYYNCDEKIKDLSLNNLKVSLAEKNKYIEIFLEITKKYKLKNIKKFEASLMKHFEKDFVFNTDLKEILMGN